MGVQVFLVSEHFYNYERSMGDEENAYQDAHPDPRRGVIKQNKSKNAFVRALYRKVGPFNIPKCSQEGATTHPGPC